MIFFYALVGVMPLTQHHFWARFVGELTIFKYIGGACVLPDRLELRDGELLLDRRRGCECDRHGDGARGVRNLGARQRDRGAFGRGRARREAEDPAVVGARAAGGERGRGRENEYEPLHPLARRRPGSGSASSGCATVS